MIGNRSTTVFARRRTAFTLIELVVVAVVMALLTMLAVVSLGGTIDRYRLSRAVETIEMFDARARRDARKSRKLVLGTIDRNENRLIVSADGIDSRFRIPPAVAISDARMPRRTVVGGDVEIEFNHEGRSPTYAVALERRGMTQWLVVLGTSGQTLVITDEREVDEILSY